MKLWLSVLVIIAENLLVFSVEAADVQAREFSRGAGRTVGDSVERRNLLFSNFGKDYNSFKNDLSQKYGFDYSLNISFLPQRGAPNGQKTSLQTIISPSFTWTTFDNQYGTGTLNFSYSMTRYGGSSSKKIAKNIGVVAEINDSDDVSNSFGELYYSYQFKGEQDWLTLAAGQFPIGNFDGGPYDSNQQVNFMNNALAQNASSTYSTAGIGAFVQVTPNSDWSFAFGAQDATNTDGISIRVNRLHEGHFATFGYVAYTPDIKGLGNSQVSLLVYNQPWVKEQSQTTNGWSLNISQNLGDKWAVFGRINGVSGSVAEIEQSWVLGAVYNNPLDRNPLDQIGVAFAYNKVDPKAVGEPLVHGNEKVIEAYWAWGISKWMTLTPDIQFYIDPALNQKSDYATVIGLRMSLFF